MRGRAALLAAIIGLSSPAFAGCHKYSIWKFPWPQRCPPAERRLIAGDIVPLPPVLDRDPEIPLPSLDGIDWGSCPEDMRARLLLRAALGDVQ